MNKDYLIDLVDSLGKTLEAARLLARCLPESEERDKATSLLFQASALTWDAAPWLKKCKATKQ